MANVVPSIRTRYESPIQRSYPVEASTHIFYGDLVIINSSGRAIPAAASASNKGCVGWAKHECDNSSGAAGALRVEVGEGEIMLFDDGAETLAISDTGLAVYASGAQKIHKTQAANEPFIGWTTELDPNVSGGMWVAVGPLVRRT